MTIKYDNDNHCEIHTCGVCGHTYHYYYDYDKQTENTEKPFIKMNDRLFYEVEVPWQSNRIVQAAHYACPICGVLQIDVG